MVWIVCCGAPQNALPGRCTGKKFDEAMAALPEASIIPCVGAVLKSAGTVYYAPGRRARETAEQAAPGAALKEEPLLAASPMRAWSDTAGEYPLWLWKLMAKRQAAAGNPRQPESRETATVRAETLIARLEENGEDCVLVPDDGFLPLLLERFRLHSYSQRRSGVGRFQPFERLLLTPRALHCGGCAHNCLLSNPGCGVGKDKAMRQNRKA